MISVFDDKRIDFTNLVGIMVANTSVSPYTSYLNGTTFDGVGGVITDMTTSSKVTGNGAIVNPTMAVSEGFLFQIGTPIIGHKYYVRLKARVTNSICQSIRVIYGGVTAVIVSTPTINTVYDTGVVFTATSATAGLSIDEVYTSAVNAAAKELEAYSIEIIDLTADCGAGLEYTSAQMSAVFALNTYTYFVGTYSFTLTDFNTQGDKVIHPISCVEIVQDNVDWRVEMTADLSYVPFLKQDYILVVPTMEKGNQPFRIKNIKIDQREISFSARHVGYDLENYISSFLFGYSYTSNIRTLLMMSLDDGLPQVPFTWSSDAGLAGRVTHKETSILGCITEIVTQVGGHLTFDWWEVSLDATIGTDKGMTIEYGKNLQGAEVVEDWNSVCTSLVPIGNNNLLLNGTQYMLNGNYILHASGVSYDRPYYRKQVFQTDDVVELETLGNAYIEANKYPKLNYKVQATITDNFAGTYAYLEGFTYGELELSTYGELEEAKKIYFQLGDIIQVKARQFTILTNVLGYTFNVLTQRIVNVEFGNFRKDVKTVFSNIQAEIAELKKQIIQENIQMNARIDALP